MSTSLTDTGAGRQSWLRVRDWPFTIKLLAPAGIGVAMIAAVAAGGSAMLANQADATRIVATEALPRAAAIAGVATRLKDINGDLYRSLTLQASGSPEATTLVATLPGRIDALAAEVQKLEGGSTSPETAASFAKLREELETYKGAVEFVSSMMGLDFAAAVSFLAPFQSNYDQMIDSLNTLVAQVEASAAETANDANERAEAALTTLLAAALLAGIIAGAVALVLASATRRSVLDIAGATRELADGKLDCDLDSLTRRDELSAVVQGLFAFRDNARERERLQREQAASNAEAVARRQVLERAVQAFRVEIEELMSALESASTSIGGAADAFEAVSRTAAQQSAGAASSSDSASASVQSIAAAVEELATSISSVAEQAQSSEGSVGDLRGRANASSDIISRLGGVCESVSQVTALIRDIADKTNLLALNATIEAARAGENGRGFAVVASEVKALADQTRHATDSIAKQIEALIGASEEVRAAIGGILTSLETMQTAAVTVSSAVVEQRAATMEISQSVMMASASSSDAASQVRALLDVVDKTANAASETRTTARSVSQSIARLRAATDSLLSQVA